MAGKSTLNRLELRPEQDKHRRYRKIEADTAGLDALLVDVFLDAHEGDAPIEVVVDVDATDDPLHGEQEGRFFYGYDKSYCYLPLYIFCGHHLLCARLRTADEDAAFAYVLMHALRRLGLADTALARAQCGTIREKVLKIGAQIRVSVRKVWLSMSESYPREGLFRAVLARLEAIPLRC